MTDQEQHIEYITKRAIELGCTYALAKYTHDLEIQIGKNVYTKKELETLKK